MLPADITALTAAFSTSTLVTGFISMAPFILGILVVVMTVMLIKWGVKKVTHKLSGGL